MTKTKLSYSAIETLAKCGVRYEFRYVKGLRRPPGVAMAIGSAVDNVANEGFRRKIERAASLAAEEVDDLAAKSLREEWAKGVEIDADESRPAKTVLGSAVDQSIRLSRGVTSKIVPQIDAASVQRAWSVDVSETIELRGIMDVQEKSGRVVDLKSKPGGKAPAAGLEHLSTQLSAYALATVALDDSPMPAPVALAYVRETRTGTGIEARVLPSVRDRPDLDAFLSRIEAAARVIESGSFMPTDPANWWCSAKWCGFWDLCIYARRPVAVGFNGEGEGEP